MGGVTSRTSNAPPGDKTRWRKALIVSVLLIMLIGLLPSAAAGWITSHPDAINESAEVPSAFADYWFNDNVSGIDVWVAPPGGRPVIVMVHGYQQPPSNLQALAEHLHARGYGIVLMELPYLDGSEPYSGGGHEAAAVKMVVEWAAATFDVPIVLAGFSAGGFASALAVQDGAPVAALITDSAFADAAATFRDVSSNYTGLPEAAFFALRPAYWLASGGGKLRRVKEGETPTVSALVIHGGADDFVPSSNATLLQSLLDAELWIAEGADHGGAWYADPIAYENRVDAFISDAVPK